jgi:hypothetical protein
MSSGRFKASAMRWDKQRQGKPSGKVFTEFGKALYGRPVCVPGYRPGRGREPEE